jgi:ABC-type multidrug transport system permease subunit
MMQLRNFTIGFEDYITFPKKGDIVTLVSKTEKIEAEVDSCPFDLKRAVAKVYFSYTNHTSLVSRFVPLYHRSVFTLHWQRFYAALHILLIFFSIFLCTLLCNGATFL